MKPVTHSLLLISLLTFASGATYAQAIANYGDIPSAEAAGTAAAANRAANGGALNPGDDDIKLLGGPAAYGDVDQTQGPGAGPQGQPAGATAFNNPGAAQPAGNALAPKAGKPTRLANAAPGGAPGAQQPGTPNAALQLYGDGTASGAARHEVYKSPW